MSVAFSWQVKNTSRRRTNQKVAKESYNLRNVQRKKKTQSKASGELCTIRISFKVLCIHQSKSSLSVPLWLYLKDSVKEP